MHVYSHTHAVFKHGSPCFLNTLEQRSPALLAPGTGFSTDWWGGRQKAELRRASLTAKVLTGHEPVPVRGLGVGDPCSRTLVLTFG